MGFQADIIGEFVDAFLADHGGIHVGQKQLLAAAGDRLHHDVKRWADLKADQFGHGALVECGFRAKG